MEKIQLPNSLRKRMDFHSSYCDKHPFIKHSEEIPNPIQKMIVKGNIVCPRCEMEKEHKRLQEEMQEHFDQLQMNEKYNIFLKSIIDDETLRNARFANYLVECDEEKINKQIALECVDRYNNGEIFNLILQGKQGTGKSHLAYAILHELRETHEFSCLFISIDAMLRKIKNSFSDKDSIYTEGYFNHLLSSVDFLVLDDLGAETGAIDTNKTATDFVQRVLYGITNMRQDKATILTTNLGSQTLFSMYDKKLISRLFKKPKYVVFRDSKDKRTSNIPF